MLEPIRASQQFSCYTREQNECKQLLTSNYYAVISTRAFTTDLLFFMLSYSSNSSHYVVCTCHFNSIVLTYYI